MSSERTPSKSTNDANNDVTETIDISTTASEHASTPETTPEATPETTPKQEANPSDDTTNDVQVDAPAATLAEAAQAFASPEAASDIPSDAPANDNEPPAEEPMPTPEECFQKHFAKANPKLHKRFTTELTDDDQRMFVAAMSLHDQAVAIEHAYRGMIPHMQNMQYMQQMIQSGQMRRNQSSRQKQQLMETVNRFQSTLKDAEDTYLDERTTLWTTVRDHLNTKRDDAQREARALAEQTKPFSKGVIKHFWQATEHDDVTIMRRTLLGAAMVKRADYAVYRPHRHKKEATRVPLLELLTGDHRYVKQDTGAVECLKWVLATYPELYSDADKQQAVDAIHAKGLASKREVCLAALA